MVQKISEYIEQNKLFLVVTSLLFVSLLYRIPFWFVDVIDWDESTFILMGKSILERNVPYIEYWDLKPPVAFLSVSAIMTLLGESIFSMRVLGALSVFLSSISVYFIVRKFFNSSLSITSALFCIPMMSIYWRGQTTFTEHIAIPFVLLALYLCIKNKELTLRYAACIGFLISLAAMIRLNLAYISVPVGIIVILYSSRSNILGRSITVGVYAFSGLLPLLIMVAFYAYIGELDTLYTSLVSAPLSYSAEQYSVFKSLSVFIDELMRADGYLYFTFKSLIFINAMIGGVITLFDLHESKDHKRIKLLVFGSALIFSVSASGGGHSHYLIQLAPVFVVFSAFSMSKLGTFRHVKVLFLVFFIFFLAIDSKSVFSEYKSVYLRVINQQPINVGQGYWAKEKIDELNLCDYSMYAMSHHIVYFLLDKKPPSPLVTHPSNLTKGFLVGALYGEEATPESELKKIMFENPTIILKKKELWYFKDYPLLDGMLGSYLAQYKIIGERNDLQIYLHRNALVNDNSCI
jgi:4-amino-4-deoxy-L-arabinose transferase-like glycosyltransferase